MPFLNRSLLLALAVGLVSLFAIACGGDDDDDDTTPTAADGTTTAAATATATTATATATQPATTKLTVYSGRAESLVGPLIADFEKATGVDVDVKYGDTAELAALLIEEGSKSPADVYFAQDAGALGAVQEAGLLATLPEGTMTKVTATYRSKENTWVGVSGRARVIVYNTDELADAKVPNSIKDLTKPEWKGKVGWAPTNGSFQAAVTAIRVLEGDAAAKAWLEAMKANDVKEYKDNRSIVSAVAAGEISLGLVNHYYLYGFLKDQGDGFKARNHFTAANDAGSLVNVAGVGIVKSGKNAANAQKFVDFLLAKEAQEYFSTQTFEYPLVTGIAADSRLKPLAEIDPPNIDLSSLDDLQGTVALLRSTGVLP
ncbi:MAG: iron ABC transporter substrate-binding protein [Dehalococcoidia bacterium]|nr:iron ABC transporter substrate-binding protein [Dehalococcoidia bacterium]